MSQITSHSQWNVTRGGLICAACATALAPGQPCFGALVENTQPLIGSASPFARLDFCEPCWSQGKRPESPQVMFTFWKTAVPLPTAKKKLFVDDAVLVDLFARLQDKSDPRDVRFRFVLALILMRKRLLRYEGTQTLDAGGDVWKMIPRGADQPVSVVDPHLTPEQISEVSGQLSQILAEEI